MEILKAITTRRSIRKYQQKPVPKETLELLLKAAVSAPSAHNQQPWHFIVIDEPAKLKEIADFAPHAQMCKRAPLAILVAADLSLVLAKGFWPQDCAAATQNILLMAHAEGLGAVWSGIHPREELENNYRKLFNLPKEVMPFALIALGYPDENPVLKERSFEKKVHYNSWQLPFEL